MHQDIWYYNIMIYNIIIFFFSIKEVMNMYELFHSRYMLHHYVCQHRVNVAIQMMWVIQANISCRVKHNFRTLWVIAVVLLLYDHVTNTGLTVLLSPHVCRIVDALLAAEEHLHYKITKAVMEPETFLTLTGSHFCFSWTVLFCSTSQTFLSDMFLLNRRYTHIHRLVGFTSKAWDPLQFCKFSYGLKEFEWIGYLLFFSDCILQEIMQSGAEDAKKIIERIEKRKLYKFICSHKIPTIKITDDLKKEVSWVHCCISFFFLSYYFTLLSVPLSFAMGHTDMLLHPSLLGATWWFRVFHKLHWYNMIQ